MVFSAVGALLALFLLLIYLRSYWKVRAKFTLTLIVVALFVLAQYSLMFYALHTMMAEFTDLVMNFLMVIMGFGVVAIGLLLFNSFK
jgi:hypothetical protein